MKDIDEQIAAMHVANEELEAAVEKLERTARWFYVSVSLLAVATLALVITRALLP